MSTNYFRPPTYQKPTLIDNTTKDFKAPELLDVTAGNEQYNKWGALIGGANYARRNRITELLGSGDASLYSQLRKNMGFRRDTARAALGGYGGIGFKAADDTSTTKDESLEIQQQTGNLGQRDIAGIQGAKAGASQIGLRGRARAMMIGAALQNVSEEARGIIRQYASDINGMTDAYKTDADALVAEWGQLYGKDANDALTEQLRVEAQQAAQAAQAERARQEAAAAAPAAAPTQTGHLWTGFSAPNETTLNQRFGAGKWKVGQSWKINPSTKKRQKFYVVVPK